MIGHRLEPVAFLLAANRVTGHDEQIRFFSYLPGDERDGVCAESGAGPVA